MAANLALWADIQRDLEVARTKAVGLMARAEALERHGAELPPDLRIDRELAIGAMLHHCFGAMESALERLIEAIDGGLPMGRNYHVGLIRRAVAPVPGVRPAIISPALAADLQQLRQYAMHFATPMAIMIMLVLRPTCRWQAVRYNCLPQKCRHSHGP